MEAPEPSTGCGGMDSCVLSEGSTMSYKAHPLRHLTCCVPVPSALGQAVPLHPRSAPTHQEREILKSFLKENSLGSYSGCLLVPCPSPQAVSIQPLHFQHRSLQGPEQPDPKSTLITAGSWTRDLLRSFQPDLLCNAAFVCHRRSSQATITSFYALP